MTEFFFISFCNVSFIVFLKDVSKQTLEDLITFIYSGEVDVKQENLAELLKTAKALEIKGLVDDSYATQLPIPDEELNSMWSPQVYDKSQYQSIQTVRHNQFSASSSYCVRDEFEFTKKNESNRNEHGNQSEYADGSNDDYGFDGGDMAMTTDQQNNAEDNEDDYHGNEIDEPKSMEANAPRAKCAKRGLGKWKRFLDLGENRFNIILRNLFSYSKFRPRRIQYRC